MKPLLSLHSDNSDLPTAFLDPLVVPFSALQVKLATVPTVRTKFTETLQEPACSARCRAEVRWLLSLPLVDHMIL